MLKTFKYRIYPNNTQKSNIQKTLNLCRFLYNNALEQRISVYKDFGATLSYNKQAKELPELKKSTSGIQKRIFASVAERVKTLRWCIPTLLPKVGHRRKGGFSALSREESL